MKLTLLSNYLTHHQTPLCECFNRNKTIDFCFISTIPMEREREQMGWSLNRAIPYEIKSYASPEDRELAQNRIVQSDVLIIGACNADFKAFAYDNTKGLILLYSERIFKKGDYQALSPGAWRYKTEFQKNLKKKKAYMLCANAYLSHDLRLLGTFKNRCYRWGYFPVTKEYADICGLIDSKKQATLLWVGRLLQWKHPEDALYAAARLRDSGYRFKLRIIGEGPQFEMLAKHIEEEALDQFVQITGFVSTDEVRKHMESADIYLFTSDRHEGWGAVLNEAMNSACAVVASKEAGAVPYLINNDSNGLIYDRKKKDDLYKRVKWLLDHPDEKRGIQQNAYKTIRTLWNAQTASERLLQLSEHLLNDQPSDLFQNGPCSKADYL